MAPEPYEVMARRQLAFEHYCTAHGMNPDDPEAMIRFDQAPPDDVKVM